MDGGVSSRFWFQRKGLGSALRPSHECRSPRAGGKGPVFGRTSPSRARAERSGSGASLSLPHLPAKVSSLNAERPLSLGGGNWPSCPPSPPLPTITMLGRRQAENPRRRAATPAHKALL